MQELIAAVVEATKTFKAAYDAATLARQRANEAEYAAMLARGKLSEARWNLAREMYVEAGFSPDEIKEFGSHESPD